MRDPVTARDTRPGTLVVKEVQAQLSTRHHLGQGAVHSHFGGHSDTLLKRQAHADPVRDPALPPLCTSPRERKARAREERRA